VRSRHNKHQDATSIAKENVSVKGDPGSLVCFGGICSGPGSCADHQVCVIRSRLSDSIGQIMSHKGDSPDLIIRYPDATITIHPKTEIAVAWRSPLFIRNRRFSAVKPSGFPALLVLAESHARRLENASEIITFQLVHHSPGGGLARRHRAVLIIKARIGDRKLGKSSDSCAPSPQ